MFSSELKCRLRHDLKYLGLPVHEVKIGIRPFSNTYYGNYYPTYGEKGKIPRIYVYPYENKSQTKRYPYEFILDTVIHEMCHHLQHRNPKWVRLKGKMHDKEFWKLYNYYIYKAKLLGVMKDEYRNKTA